MPDKPDDLRAGDSDRASVAEQLRAALNEGRLTLAEYDERLGQAYAARTYGELNALLTDLPASPGRSPVVPASSIPPAAAALLAGGHTRRWIAAQWSSWLCVALVLTAIWALSGGGSYWPGWVIGVWGAICTATTISGLMRGEPRRQAERHARKEMEREQRRRAELEGRHGGTNGQAATE